ncbi:light-harvesting complex-like protein OHP2, chloroplastic [Diospyros lotus]|uniref:light-harvesting complex-like protein OHP2, chloroplastic n=1 Tax=Diospyros lotus TaxID=55363 RepID=UPI00224D3D48|nr:light-harvesting complex-like protein OHP2, chloroplastic [Diospyros lotus]
MSVASSPIPFIKIPKSSSPSSSSSFSCSSPSPSSSSCSSSSPSSFRFSLSKPSVLTIRSSQTEGPLRRPLAPSPPPAVKPLQPPSPTPPAPKPSPPSVAAPVKEKGAAVVTLEFQRQMAKELQDYFKQKKLEEANKGPVFGFVGKNEISNGRWAMFGFAVGLLTEYATGYDLVDQVKILLSNFGIVDLE